MGNLTEELRGIDKTSGFQTLDQGMLERVSSWGGASHTVGYVARPSSPSQITQAYNLAFENGMSIGFRGGGNSYGDAASNEGNIVLDLTRMTRILDWNPETGVITVEPGVTLRSLWEYVLADGWWPPVCTGTMHVTMGGAAAMNVHGKNAYKVGTLGEHILDFDLLMPNGETITASPTENSDIFYAAIGGFGMLGVFTRLTLQMKRIYSGLLEVETKATGDLSAMFRYFNDGVAESDYLVGWVDSTASGRALGRGEVHVGRYLREGGDLAPQQSMRLSAQHLSDSLFGIYPRSGMWRLMRPFSHQLGYTLINTAKYLASVKNSDTVYRQPHAQFHFLLNYFPDWQKATGKGGLIQYQPFVPDAHAERVFKAMLDRAKRQGISPYLAVLKRHKPDPFLLTHGLDGWSLACDFQVTPRNKGKLVKLLRDFDDLILDANGRFYPAKDSFLRPSVAQAYLGEDAIAEFKALKKRCDPKGVIQTNFWRRVFGG